MPSLRTALVLGLTAAAAAVAPAGTAAAAGPVVTPGPVSGQAAADALTPALAPVKHLTLDPLAGTGVDPLDNSLGSQVADFQPLSTAGVTAPLTHGATLADLPLTARLVGLLPG